MKTTRILAILALAIAGSAARAGDSRKLENAQRTVERVTQAQPPSVSTTTVRTPTSAAQEYKSSGPAPNNARGGLHIKELPKPQGK